MSDRFAPNARACRRLVFVRGLEVQALLGVHPHERTARQRVVIGVDPSVEEDTAPGSIGLDELHRMVDYERVVNLVRAEAGGGHTLLVETLAEWIAAAVLDDPRIRRARVNVEKPDAFRDVAAVGVSVEREAA